jgi:hypothetical protein
MFWKWTAPVGAQYDESCIVRVGIRLAKYLAVMLKSRGLMSHSARVWLQ